MTETASRSLPADSELIVTYGHIDDLEDVLDEIHDIPSYYEKLFHWVTDLSQKHYLFQHVAPMLDGRFLVYPREAPESKSAIILDKSALFTYFKEVKTPDNEGNTPLISIFSWSIFVFMISIYLLPIRTSVIVSVSFFVIWIIVREFSKKHNIKKLNKTYSINEKFYDDRYKILREVIGDFVYRRRKFLNVIVDFIISFSSLSCVIYAFIHFLLDKHYFFTGAALVGLVYLSMFSARYARNLWLIARFRRNARRDPTYEDLADIAPEAPMAPRFF